jgi:tRNA (adenine22-N1)-methyltransferase
MLEIMELKGRLKAIADFVKPCETLCDIGTDHAYIPIYLINNKICGYCIATDIKKGPLKKAKKNILESGLQERIEIRQGYGLETVSQGEEDTFIIAGIGGNLVNEILSRGKDKAMKGKSFVLQPMNAVEKTRKWLIENGYFINKERLQKEGEKMYNILEAVWCNNIKKEDDIYYYIGKKLIDSNDPLLLEYIKNNINRLSKKINGLILSTQKEGLDNAVLLREKMIEIYNEARRFPPPL